MKRILGIALMAFACAGAITLEGCAAPPGSSATAGSSFNDQVAIGYQTITAVRNSTADMLTSGAITLDQAIKAQAVCDAVQSALDGARAVRSTDPTKAQTQLASALQNLADVQAGLTKKKGGV